MPLIIVHYRRKGNCINEMGFRNPVLSMLPYRPDARDVIHNVNIRARAGDVENEVENVENHGSDAKRGCGKRF